MVPSTLRIVFGVFVIFSISFLLSLYHQELRYQKIKRHKSSIAIDSITALDNLTFILAPYYDPRDGPSVRVLSILHVSVKELYCVFHCAEDRMDPIKAEIETHSDRWGFPYATTDLVCPEPSGCDYNYMSFRGSNSSSVNQNIIFEVKNRPLPAFSSNFTICLSTLYGGYNNVLQVVQSLEMYKILGAARVTMYITNVSQSVEKVLRHYVDEGTVEVVPWPIDRHFQTTKRWHYVSGDKGQVGYYGQAAAVSDCLYRNMYKSKFVFLNDIDEIILPVMDRDYPNLMERLQELHPDTNVFRIDNQIFTVLFNDSKFDRWPHVPGTNILSHPFRELDNRGSYYHRKMIVNPRNVVQISIHFPVRHTGKLENIANSLAILFHCKFKGPVTRDQVMWDDILRQYNLTLVPNVDKVIQKLFPHH